MGKETRATVKDPIADWVAFDWRKAEQTVYRLQKRIFRARNQGKTQVVHNLQRKLERSFFARMLAVRKVTQDNQGKKTAGVDGKTALTTAERVELVKDLKPEHRKRQKPQPVRRVWIPKPGKTEKRPLGIPTIRDRAEQAVAKLALEPEWEAVFEPNSYGFRPGRSAQDAIAAIFDFTCRKAKYVLDADIAGCFDHISHEALLEKLQTYPAMRRYIRGCLKAGVMEGQVFSKGKRKSILPTEEGTPQGGVISPLLANIALHGLEAEIARGYKSYQRPWPQVIRYADDFVILCDTKEKLEESRKRAEAWLKTIGLEMKPSKTRVTHTLEPVDGNVGFDFLGFQVKQYRVGKSHSSKDSQGNKLGFTLLIKPTREAKQEHLKSLKQTIRKHRSRSQEILIKELSPKTRGWSNYYKTVVAADCFRDMDWYMNNMLWKWATWSDKGSRKTLKEKYWQRTDGKRWEFRTKNNWLYYHTRTKITRHKKVVGTASPFDGNMAYWAKRVYDGPVTKNRVGRVLRQQKGQCAGCGLYLRDGDLIELDHFIPKRLGGKDEISNLRAYHRHCHDQKTRADGANRETSESLVRDDNEQD